MREITKYIVTIGYRRFVFSDGETALDFAETAKLTMEITESKYKDDNLVSVEIEAEEVAE